MLFQVLPAHSAVLVDGAGFFRNRDVWDEVVAAAGVSEFTHEIVSFRLSYGDWVRVYRTARRLRRRMCGLIF